MKTETRDWLEAHMNPMLDHEDHTKCGICWKNKLMADVAKEQLNKDQEISVPDFYAEVDRRFKETDLYKRVRAMIEEGKTIDEIEILMRQEGIEI